jgi:hypothetical protein
MKIETTNPARPHVTFANVAELRGVLEMLYIAVDKQETAVAMFHAFKGISGARETFEGIELIYAAAINGDGKHGCENILHVLGRMVSGHADAYSFPHISFDIEEARA